MSFQLPRAVFIADLEAFLVERGKPGKPETISIYTVMGLAMEDRGTDRPSGINERKSSQVP